MDSVLGGADDADTFARAHRIGVAGVEVNVTRERLRAGALPRTAHGLAVPTLVLGEHNHGGIADPDPAVAAAAREDVKAAVAWAAEVGADAVLVPFFLRGELLTDDDVDRAGTAFAELCPLAGERGVSLLYEGTLPSARVRELAARVASPAFGVYFDLANPLVDGLDPPTELRALGDLVRGAHVKDACAKRGDVAPGLGRVDWHESARALADVGYDGWLVLETPTGPPEPVARDLSFARRFFDLEPPVEWPRFGAFSYDFERGEWGRLRETFTQLGLDSVQLGGDLLVEALEDPSAADHGLQVAALAGYRNLIAPDPSTRRENLKFIARCLETAPALGTWVVATEAGTRHPDSEWSDHPDNRGDEAWTLFLDAVETLLPVAERAGTVLALEASVKHVLRNVSRVIDVLDRFPSRHLQLVCDPYNYLSRDLLAARARHTRELFDRFEHRFVLAHGKDVGPGGAEESTPELGTGVFDQRPYVEFLRTRRPDLPLVLEHLPLDHVPAVLERVSPGASAARAIQ
jgi:sugar phosphate isomerase/epimerase